MNSLARLRLKLLAASIMIALVELLCNQLFVHAEPQTNMVNLYLRDLADLTRNDRYDDALAVSNKILKLDPVNVDAHIWKASIYTHKKDYTRALDEFKIAEKEDPKNPTVYLNRAKTYAELRDFAKSVDECNKSMNLDKGWRWYALWQRGQTYLKAKQYQKSLLDLDNCFKHLPSAEVLYDRSQARLGLGDKEGAMADLTRADQELQREIASYPPEKQGDMPAVKSKVDLELKRIQQITKLNR